MRFRMQRLGRRIGIAIGGGAVIATGAAMLVLPGPGIAVIVVGIGILSLEFERPRVWFAWLKARGGELRDRWRAWRSRRNAQSSGKRTRK
jgi:hypothetical protein